MIFFFYPFEFVRFHKIHKSDEFRESCCQRAIIFPMGSLKIRNHNLFLVQVHHWFSGFRAMPNYPVCWAIEVTAPGFKRCARGLQSRPRKLALARLEFQSPGRRGKIWSSDQKFRPNTVEVGCLTQPSWHNLGGGISNALS